MAYGVHQESVDRNKQRLLAPYKNGVINPKDFGIDVNSTVRVEYLFPFEEVNLDFVCDCFFLFSFFLTFLLSFLVAHF